MMDEHAHQWVPSIIPEVYYCKVPYCEETLDE